MYILSPYIYHGINHYDCGIYHAIELDQRALPACLLPPLPNMPTVGSFCCLAVFIQRQKKHCLAVFLYCSAVFIQHQKGIGLLATFILSDPVNVLRGFLGILPEALQVCHLGSDVEDQSSVNLARD
jgi:hypothetical protein